MPYCDLTGMNTVSNSCCLGEQKERIWENSGLHIRELLLMKGSQFVSDNLPVGCHRMLQSSHKAQFKRLAHSDKLIW